MKKAFFPFLLLISLCGWSQSYNNEWIDYSKTYYKFKVGSTGLYRINQPALASLSLGSTAAQHFQLWRNGREVALYTSVQTGPMGGSDYIEFWGEMNDGKPDNVLYSNPSFQLNDKWSLESDTSFYFLTVNTAGINLRFAAGINNLPTSLPVEPFFIHTEGKYYREKLNPGYAVVVGDHLYSSSYEDGEGWTSSDIVTSAIRVGSTNNYTVTYGTSPSVLFNNLFVFTAGPAPLVKIAVSGNSFNPRRYRLNINADSVLGSQVDYFAHAVDSVNFSMSLINSNSAEVNVTNLAVVNCPPVFPNQPIPPCGVDRLVIHKIELKYPRQFNFGGANNFSFELPPNALGNYLEISGFNHGGVAPVLYDFTNGKRYIADISTPSLVKVALEPSAVARRLILVSQSSGYPVAVTTFQQRNFVNYALAVNRGNYLIISHPGLMSSAGGGNPVEDYKTYRSSAAGGSYNAKIYLVDELMDQFGFGIKKNPLAIRNFIRWARNFYGSSVNNVFIIGKGLNYTQYRAFESDPDVERLAFVPTFGYPASDNLLAVDPSVDLIPKVPIGRISAINGDEVKTYLDKVIQYEQQQAFSSPLISDKAWLKNGVNIVGASDPYLGAVLTAGMNRYKEIISDTFCGANVTTFSKVTAAPVEQASSEKLYHLFQEGIGLITYFGHSSATTLEFNLDNPDNYINPSKYPVMIVMGCNAGNFFNFSTNRFITKETLSEKFVLANQRGSIAFIASSYLGVPNWLDTLNRNTMYSASVTKYGQTVGEMLKDAYGKLVVGFTGSEYFFAKVHCEQTTLHGDPALKLDASTNKPDYVIEDQLIKINPSFISVAETQFTIQTKFMNLGKAINRDIVVEVKRTYPDLTTTVIRRDTIRGIRFIDSLTYSIPIVSTRDKGLNKISICVDADNIVDELYETNNCITKDIFIFEDEARPVFPYNFSIVSRPDIKLIVSTANPFSTVKQYKMEIDTTELFDSPLKTTQSITSAGGVMEFNPGIAFTDSTVYYWRVAPVPATGQPVWNKSSFVYLSSTGPNSSDPGFNQSHFYQHTKSIYDRLYLDTATRSFKFGKITNNLLIQMGTWITSGATQEASLSISVNGINSIRLMCWFSSLVFNVFHPVTFSAWQNQTVVPSNYPSSFGEGLYGSTDNNCFNSVKFYNFEYRYIDTSSRHKMMNLMQNVIPDGYYVVVRNFTLDPVYAYPDAWAADWANDTTYWGPGQSLYHYLKNAGFAGIDSFYRARPWVLVYKKNDPSFTPKWLVGVGTHDNPTLSVDCFTPDTLGFVTSPVFGPSKGWKQLKWRGAAVYPLTNTTTIDVIGIRNDGTETTLFSGLTPAQQNFDISSVQAGTYPFIKLKMSTKDSSLNLKPTPYQLRYWRITYVPAPEGAIAPNIYLKAKDTVDVGEPLDFKVAFKNVSEVAFDSLKLKFVITDKNNVPHIIPIPRRRPLLVNDTLQLGTLVNTASIPGLNTMFLEANPDNDQPEQYHFNNFAFRSLYVKGDNLDPLLDVTFDGVHILNRDIVSSKPDILIKLKDEAKWLILDDTALLTVQVRYPNGSLHRYYFNNDTLQFTAAGQAPNTDNTATINFGPYFPEDGEYELIVTGKDKSNNSAGTIEYRVQFEVINKPMISNMLNYPNPFTTSTAFVFTMTGSEVPQNIKIEILTITGKIVREITKDELGHIHIGRNITEFKWDGTDQYGQKLANGVYLYRVVTNLNGKRLDKYKAKGDNTDKYFNSGYGKMYLMR